MGIADISKRPATVGRSSVLTLTTSQRPASSSATRATSGATRLHGPHHEAQKSTIIGSSERITSSLNVSSSSIWSGAAGACSAEPQRGHFAR